jgi:hypothetical protein
MSNITEPEKSEEVRWQIDDRFRRLVDVSCRSFNAREEPNGHSEFH